MAADDVAIAEGIAVFARADGDAGHVVEHVAQVGRALFLQLLFGQHLDRLRGFCQRLHATQIARGARLVGHARLRVRIDVGSGVLDRQRVEDDLILGTRILRLCATRDQCRRQADCSGCGAPSGAAEAERANDAPVTIPH